MQDFFPTMAMKANPQCNDRYCRRQQEEYKVCMHASDVMVWVNHVSTYFIWCHNIRQYQQQYCYLDHFSLPLEKRSRAAQSGSCRGGGGGCT